MTDNPMRALFDGLVADPNTPNVVATYTDADGNLVVIVLDDSPEVLASWVMRAPGIKFVKGGPFVAYDNIARMRPAPGGISTGHYAITAGTLGLVVRDKIDNSISVLSNNHVYANINRGVVGDDLLQPGPVDEGKRIGDTFADLTRFVRLRNGATVDCAIGKVRNPEDVTLNILDLGYCYGVGDPFIDEKVWKSGRTSEITRGPVIAVDAVVEVGYGPSQSFVINDCIISTIESAPGDSGSAILDFASNRIVGLLFAGGGGYTIANKASNVFAQLNIGTIAPPEITRSMFVDVSHWQGAIDFALLKSRGVRGVIMKICQGASLIDDKFAEYYDAAKAAGLLVGGYIFVDPVASAQAHYNNFVMAIGDRKLDLPVALDVEKRGDGLTAIVQNLSSLITSWQGTRPIIYTSVSFWNDNIAAWSEWKNHPLWIAYWSDFAFRPLVPTAWQGVEPVLWQFDVNDNGAWFGVGSRQVDTNLTFPSFERLLEGAPPPPPPPPDEKAVFEHYKGVNVLGVGINIRTGPSTAYSKAGVLPDGTTVEIMETLKDSPGNDWVRIGYREWCAQFYNGKVYIRYVLEGE